MSKLIPVGGQAVLEGVMMRSPNSLAVAVRRPNKEIVVKEAIWHSIWDKLTFLRWPFLRGSIVMAEAMMNGMQALNFSAQEALPEDEKSEAESNAEESSFANKMMFVLPMIFSLLLAIGLFKYVPHMAATYAGKLFAAGQLLTVDDTLYHVFDGVVKITIFILYIVAIGFIPDIRRVFMYHGAEHMGIYTYEAGEELTVENARKKSTLHPRCGTAFIMVVILVFMVVAALVLPYLPDVIKPGEGKSPLNHLYLVLCKLPLLIPVAGVAYEFNRFAGKHGNLFFIKPFIWPGLAMQLLTTKRPTDDQLEISLTALRTSLWREKVGHSVKDGDEPLVFKNFEEFVKASDNLRPVDSDTVDSDTVDSDTNSEEK